MISSFIPAPISLSIVGTPASGWSSLASGGDEALTSHTSQWTLEDTWGS